jgi:CDP-glucose 4,6-dehydratase
VTREFWKSRPVLVTGATGLLGGWLLHSLLDADASVVVLVRDCVPTCVAVRDGLLQRATVVNGSLLDSSLLRRVLSEYEIDTVFHLGAQTLVGVAKQDPVGTLETNIQGTWKLLEAARQSKVKQFLFASSDKAYGISEKLPYRETDPCEGIYPYDVSKSCGDLICRMYAATYGLPVGIVRCGNLYGGGDLNFSRTIPGLIQATVRNERFLIRSDGKFVRDFLYVKDAANAYLVLAERLAADRKLIGEAFNFSLELRLTVLDIVRRVLAMMGRTDLEPIIQNIASAEIREQYMSSEKAHGVLGWKPLYTLEDGLAETISWYENYFNVPVEQVSATTHLRRAIGSM